MKCGCNDLLGEMAGREVRSTVPPPFVAVTRHQCVFKPGCPLFQGQDPILLLVPSSEHNQESLKIPLSMKVPTTDGMSKKWNRSVTWMKLPRKAGFRLHSYFMSLMDSYISWLFTGLGLASLQKQTACTEQEPRNRSVQVLTPWGEWWGTWRY